MVVDDDVGTVGVAGAGHAATAPATPDAHCSTAHGVVEAIEAGGWPLLGHYKGHARVRRLVGEGYQILTF